MRGCIEVQVRLDCFGLFFVVEEPVHEECQKVSEATLVALVVERGVLLETGHVECHSLE